MRNTQGWMVAVAILSFSTAAMAQWIPDGMAIRIGACDSIQVISDGAGGAIITWQAGVYSDIYVQRVSALGEVLWETNGVPVCTASSDQWHPALISDGAGGAIITWEDHRTWGYGDIYVQRVSASGQALWTTNGVPLCTATNDQTLPRITADGAGGAIVAWEDDRGGIYVQRVNVSGAPQWTPDGVFVSGGWGYSPIITSDNAGGAIVVWTGYPSSLARIFAQRVDGLGSVLWTNAVALCNVGEQTEPAIVSDGANGAIVTWRDRRMADIHIYAQRVDGAGAIQWTSGGVALCAAARDQYEPRITSDGGGGAFVSWMDYRSGSNFDIYAQRVNASGAVQWMADGVALCTTPEHQYHPRIASDCAGGGIVTWEDYRGSLELSDIYAQRVNGLGDVQWTANGVAVCAAPLDQFLPEIVSDGDGGAIAAWRDWRDDSFGYPLAPIYAQRIERNGYWGYPAPFITSVLDAPGDQGGIVQVYWNASRLDPLPEGLISNYTIWRAIGHPTAETLARGRIVSLENLSKSEAQSTGPFIRVERAGTGTRYWELVSTVSHSHASSYSAAASTLFDSSSVCREFHYFQVIAHTVDPREYWISAPDSGRSVDNVAPLAPSGLAGEYEHSSPGLHVTWDPNIEPDFERYALYRGTSSDFVPGPGNLLASPVEASYVDGSWTWSSGYCYKVSAIDVHGNESAYAPLDADALAGSNSHQALEASYLLQNFPNPFNPVTRIEFGLKASATASLTIHDAAGRLVRVLHAGLLPSGRYAETWDGKDENGSTVSSGVYFYRLDAGGFTQTKKMVLLR